MSILEHLTEAERTNVVVGLLGLFVSVVGLATPFASAWLTQRIIHRREFRRDAQKVFLDIVRQIADYRTASANAALASYQSETLHESLVKLGPPPDPSDEEMSDEEYESAEKVFSEAGELAGKAHDEVMEKHLKKHELSVALVCSAQAIELLFGNKGKKLCESLVAVNDLPELKVSNISDESLAETISSEEKRIDGPFAERISAAMDELWATVK